MAHILPSGRWRALIRRKGFGNESRVFDSQTAAERWERQRLSHMFATKSASTPGPSLAEVVRAYLASPRFMGKAEGTKSRERCCADGVLYRGRIHEPTGEDRKGVCYNPRALRDWVSRKVDSIDGRDIQDYIDAREQERCWRAPFRKISPDSVRLEVRFLSAVFKFAVQSRFRETNPALGRINGFSVPSPQQRDSRITPEQEESLLANAYRRIRNSTRSNPSLFPWLDFVRSTGCRPGEAAKIRVEWVKLDERYVEVPRPGTKRRKPRRVLLSDRLLQVLGPQLLRAAVEGSDYLFFSRARDGRLIPYQYHSAWRSLRSAAGVRSEAHGMRREYIARLFEQTTLNDGQISLLVGDVNPLSLEPYRHLRAEALRRHFEAFETAQTKARLEAEANTLRSALKRLAATGMRLTSEQTAFLRGKVGLMPKIDPAGDRDMAAVAVAVRHVRAAARHAPRSRAKPRASAISK